MTIWTSDFWKGAAERALKTFVQTGVASVIASIGVAQSAWDVDWLTALYAALGVALLATFFSVATSLGNAGFVAGGVVVPGEVVYEESLSDETDDAYDPALEALVAEPSGEREGLPDVTEEVSGERESS